MHKVFTWGLGQSCLFRAWCAILVLGKHSVIKRQFSDTEKRMPYIKKDFVDKLLTRVDIVDVINSRVRLKKAGNSYTCCCPFHDEKTPSFSVNQKKQFFNCFGCHEAGNAIKFIMNYDNVSFAEAVEEIASMAGMEVEYDESNTNGKGGFQANKPEVDYYQLLEQAVLCFHEELKRAPQAVAYLSSRGITAETIEKYKIGFAPDSWDFILKQVGQNNPTRVKALFEVGLVNEKTGNGKTSYYDNFRNRVIIPIRDRRGRTVAFGGRVLTDIKPKYINSKESPVYSKGHELFNLDYVRDLKQEERRFVMITEGYMDVIALDQFGVHNAVASLGTATTTMQLDLLFKQADRIVFCYDGDEAGRHAAWRALENSVPTMRDDKELCFCFLPPEHDPDTMVRAVGASGFLSYLDKADSFSDYVGDMMKVKYNLNSDGGRIAMLNETGNMAAQMVNAPITRSTLATKMARLANWDVARVEAVWRNLARSMLHNEGAKHFGHQEWGSDNGARRSLSSNTPQDVRMTAVRSLVAHLLQYPYLKNEIPDLPVFQKLLKDYADKKMEIINDLLSHIATGSEHTGLLVEKYRNSPCYEFMNYLAGVDLEKSDDNIEIKVADLLTLIKALLVEVLVARNVELQSKLNLTKEELLESQTLERRIRNLRVV